jgi:hypothetical protein
MECGTDVESGPSRAFGLAVFEWPMNRALEAQGTGVWLSHTAHMDTYVGSIWLSQIRSLRTGCSPCRAVYTPE